MQIVVSGLGMVCSLGPDAVTACAAARAGLTRTHAIAEYCAFDPATEEVEPVLGHGVPTLTRGFRGAARLARLAVPAFGDLLAQAPVRATELTDTDIVLVLPSGFLPAMADALREREAEAGEDLPPVLVGPVPLPSPDEDERRAACRTKLLARLLGAHKLPPPRRQVLLFEDQAGIGTALELAIDRVRRGEATRCIVGGVDSYLEADFLAAADALDTLKTPENPVGFMPGEAAAFVLVEPLESARRAGRRPLLTLLGAHRHALAPHQFSPEPEHGRALVDVVTRAAADLPRGCGLLVGGCNGTEWSATQWGCSLGSLPATLRGLPHWQPVASFGEAGAASGLLGLGLAARAHARGYAPGSGAIVWALSASGATAAVAVEGV